MEKANKEYLLSHLSDRYLYDAFIDLMDSKMKDSLGVIGSSEKDPIAKMYKLLSVDAVVSCINDIKATLTEIHTESTK